LASVRYNSTQNYGSKNEKEGHPITFDKPTEFIIKNYWAGDKNAEITVNNKEVFQLVQMQAPNMCTFAIDSMSGDRLLSIRKPWNSNERELELLRSTDPSVSNSQTASGPVPICKVVRKSNTVTMHSRYEVQPLDPTVKNFDCNGHWPNGFTFEANPSGETLASTTKSQPIDFNDPLGTGQEWKLQVSAGEDAVLFIGIACAITYMRHETSESKKRFLNKKGPL